MIVMVATMLAMWLAMLAAPATPIGRLFRSLLVDRPAARLNRLTAGHVALVLLGALAVAVIAWVGEGDGLRVLAMAAPEATAWLTTFEVATYLDVAVTALTAWSAARLRLPLLAFRPRGARSRYRRAGAKRSMPAANDDEPGDRRIAA
jgi:hypothetical protein